MAMAVDDNLTYEAVNGLSIIHAESLLMEPGLLHAVYTRVGGVSQSPYASLNLGHSVGDAPEAVDINMKRALNAVHVPQARVVTCHLVHSAEVRVVGNDDAGHVVGKCDGLVTEDREVFLFMRFADCLPILINDPVRDVVSLAHAGWRGTVKNVAGAVVNTMVDRLGCAAENLVAVLGPAIGPCCYEIGEEVIEAVTQTFGSDFHLLANHHGNHAHFDLWEANRRQLATAGVDKIFKMPLCTACNVGHFFSHRAEKGLTGRFGVVIGYTA